MGDTAHGPVRTTSGYLISGGKMPNKALGQHWLKDRLILEAIADSAQLTKKDAVVEVGPGLGTLTSVLLQRAGSVVAVEYDSNLAQKLPGQFPGTRLTVVNADFLTFDLGTLPARYKLVANVPYYITQKIVEHCLSAVQQPEVMVLLVQQEVAEKLAAKPGRMSVISVMTQLVYDVSLGVIVPKELFTPPPKVESQVVVCKKASIDKQAGTDKRQIIRLVKAGFSAPRKKLFSALSGGLGVDKKLARKLLEQVGIDPECRAADVSVDDWVRLVKAYEAR